MSVGLGGVDHLVYVAPDLAVGSERVAKLLGVEPQPGGRHPGYGTHNAVVSLGGETYLEVIAIDPDLPRPEGGYPFGLDWADGPGLATWALRCEDIEGVTPRADGLGLGALSSGSRERPDGVVLRWTLTDPRAMPMGGAVPFLIGWGRTPHPATSAPRAGVLREFHVVHPEPESARAALDLLGSPVEVVIGDRVGFRAVVETPGGLVDLR